MKTWTSLIDCLLDAWQTKMNLEAKIYERFENEMFKKKSIDHALGGQMH